MKSFDLLKIKEICEKYTEKTPYGWLVNDITPLELLISCGWDKSSYDEYCTKLEQNLLIGKEKEVFEIIYTTMLKVLAQIEKKGLLISKKSGRPLFNPNMCKILLETYGYAKKFLPHGKEIINKKMLMVQQEQEKNTSDIDFNRLSKEL